MVSKANPKMMETKQHTKVFRFAPESRVCKYAGTSVSRLLQVVRATRQPIKSREQQVALQPTGKVFGIGWSKTGTTTLGLCFELLGYDHQGQRLDLIEDLAKPDLSRIMALAQQKDTFEDWPWIPLYKEFDKAFPGSRFVLTIREPNDWLRSYRNMLRAMATPTDAENRMRQILYGLPFPDVTDRELLARYNRHNNEVRAYFKYRPNDLLVVNWGKGDGWHKLCSFLQKPAPDIPFPRANRGAYKSHEEPSRS